MKRIILFPFEGNYFVFLFILNIIANFSNYYMEDDSNFAFLATIGLSGLSAYLESGVCNIFRNRTIQKSIFIFLAFLYNLIIVVEAFMISRFYMILNQTSITIIEESTKYDILNFFQNYITPYVCILTIVLLIIGNGAIWFISLFICKQKYKPFAYAIIAIGIGISAYTTYNYYKYRQGLGIPQYTAITRIAHSLYISNGRVSSLDNIIRICSEIEVNTSHEPIQDITLVIGESHSFYHTSFLGYDKETYPHLGKLDSEHFLIYEDVVTPQDITLLAMQSIYSLDDTNYTNAPIFPVCFKKAGFKTILMDNHYLTSNKPFVIINKELSDLNFDYRNHELYSFDEDLVKNAPKYKDPSLTIFHLNGQHYNYASKYPKEFTKFTMNDYDAGKYTVEQRELIAEYDNACYYNDYVLTSIIQERTDEDAIVIYFPDHGEEVFECQDFNGHGTAATSPDINYQAHIPMFIWVSDIFIELHPALYQKLVNSRGQRICTINTSHFLLDLADIQVEGFDPSRSFINENYDALRHRIIMNTIDYDR